MNQFFSSIIQLLDVLVNVFLNFRQSQASCVPLFPVSMLRRAGYVLTPALYLTDSLNISLSKSIEQKMNKYIYQIANLFL